MESVERQSVSEEQVRQVRSTEPVDTRPKLLDRAAIRTVEDQVYEMVNVPEWGGQLRVKGITALERDAYETDILHGKGKDRDVSLKLARAKLVVRACVDYEGERVFSEGDINMLGGKSAAALNRVYDVAARLAGITESEMDELLDGFTQDPSSASPSD